MGPLPPLPCGWYDRNATGENDHYAQPGTFYRSVLNEQDEKNLVQNIVASMSGITGPKKEDIINRQLCHFFRADIGFGMAVAAGLGVMLDPSSIPQHKVSQMV